MAEALGLIIAAMIAALAAFPERLEALRTEINEILPKQTTAITNTEEFSAFREHLLTLAPLPSRYQRSRPCVAPTFKNPIDWRNIPITLKTPGTGLFWTAPKLLIWNETGFRPFGPLERSTFREVSEEQR